MLHGIMIISKVLIMTTARTIYRKICNVRNLTFYNICQNLGFQLLEKDWEICNGFSYQVVSLQNQNFTKNLQLGLSLESV